MLPLQIDYIVIKSDTCGTISHSSINWLLLGLLIWTPNNFENGKGKIKKFHTNYEY